MCGLFKVTPPAAYLRVTENVPQIVGFIERIIQNGHAYATQDGGYFGVLTCKMALIFLIDCQTPVCLQVMCILTLSPSVNATASLEEQLILNQNLVSCPMSKYSKIVQVLQMFLVLLWCTYYIYKKVSDLVTQIVFSLTLEKATF